MYTSRLIKYVGITVVLCLLPFITLAGFAYLAFSPGVLAITVVQITRRIAKSQQRLGWQPRWSSLEAIYESLQALISNGKVIVP